MHLLVINPNSSHQMTQDIKDAVMQAPGSDVEVDVVSMPDSPEVLESYRDYTKAAASMIAFIESGKADGYNGVLIACFGDPGLAACKELLDVPCIGIAEAAMSRALLLGGRFSILAASSKAAPMMDRLVDEYGMSARSAGTVSLRAPIKSFLGQPAALTGFVDQALTHGGLTCDVLIFGCAGMTELDAGELERKHGIAIIDPIVCGLSTLISLVVDGARVSRAGLYATQPG